VRYCRVNEAGFPNLNETKRMTTTEPARAAAVVVVAPGGIRSRAAVEAVVDYRPQDDGPEEEERRAEVQAAAEAQALVAVRADAVDSQAHSPEDCYSRREPCPVGDLQ
jgi:hypothetical protein